MMTTFNINYHTGWGESLTLVFKDRKCPMQWTGNDIWSTRVNCTAAELKDYGYVVVRDGLTIRGEWKRHSAGPAAVINDIWLDGPAGCEFTRKNQAVKFNLPGFRGAGTAVPVFSLRSESDFGIGEFRDLHALIDWAVLTGQCIIQLLPVNDTTRKGGWADSYPYNPVSSFALNPMYIHLQDLGIKETKEFRKLQKELNDLPEIDYPRVFKEKMRLIRQAFDDRGAKDMARPAFRKFCRDNSFWLDEYTGFCAKRDSDEKEYHAWIQYHLDKQLSEEAAYARSKEVSLKGDLPIGVSADSAEAYCHPELFNLDSSAGAPPDYFSADGQKWGFPTYNWEKMEENGYVWWKRRLEKMSEYFDAFRIDHILGFFRIWEIPVEAESGKLGHFNPAIPYSAEEITSLGLPLEGLFHEDPRNPGKYQPLISPDTGGLEDWKKERFTALHDDFFYHRHDEFWKRGAERKFSEILGATGMLACGEDLGMLSDCVPGVMAEQRILSLEMPMMEKGRPWPRLSVCTTSSHDMNTLRMQQDGDPAPCFCREKLWECLSSCSMLAIFPIQDWLSIDGGMRRPERGEERINEPSNPAHHWRYRLHVPVGTLLTEKASNLNSEIESLLKKSLRFFTVV